MYIDVEPIERPNEERRQRDTHSKVSQPHGLDWRGVEILKGLDLTIPRARCT